jgi:MFS family permease
LLTRCQLLPPPDFDLRLAVSSLSIDLVAFALYTIAPLLLSTPSGSNQHLSLFLLAAFLQSLGTGATPALQSLALAHVSPRDAGKLFASLSVLQSLASQVIGPLIFGVAFMRTVGRWSEAIFALATLLAAVSLAALSCVRLRRVWVGPVRSDGEAEEPPKIAGEDEALLSGRGRSTTRRDSRAGSSGFSLTTE